jgi:UDP-N-acetyl-D-glucosamine dehydrogenase
VSAQGLIPGRLRFEENDPMSTKAALLARIADRSAVVGVFGLGYVGLPLALCFSEAGFRVLGFDNDPEKIAALEAGRSYLRRFPDSAIRAAKDSGFEATGDYRRSADVDALVICVPTPLDAHREPDLSFVTGTVDAFLPRLRAGQIVSLESTTYPGTTEEELRPRIESRGLTIGDDVFLCFSPEREDPGNPLSVTRAIPKICGGSTPACLEVGRALYGAAIERIVPVSSTRAAELTKLLENIHRAVNIGLVNEMKIIADRMGLDIHEIIRAAATKPFGFVPYTPGPGLGGHCIPIDPFYLTWKVRQYGVNTRFIELAGEINHAMPDWVMEKLTAALNVRRKPVNGSRVLVLGVAYKKNVEDMRESPSLRLIALLQERGASVDYSDPFVPSLPRLRSYALSMASVEPTPASVARYDAVLLATDHDAFDYDMIARHARLIVDTRGRYLDPRDNVVKA